MVKKMLIDATHAEETRVVVVDGNKVEEFDFETVNKRQLAGNIYLAKVTRVEPSLQAAFVDYGGNRHGFLAFAEIHPDYYQIPVADRRALLEEERAYQKQQDEEDNRRRRSPRRAAPAAAAEAVQAGDAMQTAEIGGMGLVDLGEETGADALYEAPANGNGNGENGDEPYRAMDHATEIDDEIESVAEEDVAEEIAEPRRPRPRKYKIQEVVKVRQIMLVQVVKEERGNKGAALTTYLSLAGRYCVLMPNTARGGGISRKITQAADRKKLKEIAGELDVPEGAGLIIRTAGAKRTKAEIKRDYEYLMRLWEQVRELTLKSIAPAPIYEEGNLIKRTIRDLYNREIEEVLVEGEAGYRTAKDFMKMIMPSHAKQVQPYVDQVPLFARYQVESYLAGMFNPVVQLKSGGYIVIGVTEALVAIDVNSGRATKEGSIEETALKTNLEASEEIARQLRLRDLAGLIVIDFIDMEERKNNLAVEKRLKDKLKTDRARIQVGRISGFGLLEMSRQRLRPGMLESTTQPCSHCHGTGLIRSDDSQALAILRALEEEGTRKRSKEVLLKAPVGIVNFLINQKREHVASIEARYGMAVRMEADPALVSPDYSIEKFKTATRLVTAVQSPVVSLDATAMPDLVEDDEDLVEEDPAEAEEAAEGAETPAADGDGGQPRKKRRRRRRRRGGNGTGPAGSADALADDGSDDGADDEGDEDAAEAEAVAEVTAEPAVSEPAPEPAVAEAAAAEPAPEPEAEAEPEAPKKRTRTRTRKPKADAEAAEAVAEPAPEPAPAPVAEEAAPAKKRAPRKRTTKPKAEAAESPAEAPAPEATAAAPAATPKPKAPARAAQRAAEPAPVAVEAPAPEPAPVAAQAAEPVAETVAADAPAPEPAAADDAAKPKRKGWWAR
ncbi:Rne/Rng family ribonuclease [Ruixingdingia sedimenti]|uniref:Ribonuclease E n=1 Tax=Ruixingdingia sedimenti TaxID=3073604 RepID=A0ABU1F542_9RHOB|nr:ribonuclease E/G [Xinfangfangia sp. LG-4]MDR5651944.1 ribonuclease E/G [Xinfangfangia sp. LG-4]